MSIKKESLAALLVKLGAFTDKTKAIEAIEAEAETDVSIPDGTRIYSKTEWEGDGSDGGDIGVEKRLRNEGIAAGKEILVKEIKKEQGLTFEGKSHEKMLEAMREKFQKESGGSVDEKVAEVKKENDQLRAALGERDAKITELTGSIEKSAKVSKFKSLLPANRDPRLSDDDYLKLMDGAVEIGSEGNDTFLKVNGSPVKDDKFQFVKPDQALANLFKERGWIKPDEGEGAHGRGGGGSAAGTLKFTKLSEISAYLQRENIPIGSQRANEVLQKAKMDNPDIDLKS